MYRWDATIAVSGRKDNPDDRLAASRRVEAGRQNSANSSPAR
jgi:hypothetical protein